MKYRRLNLEELEMLKSQFVKFLAVNGIAADDWEKIKAKDPLRMAQLLDDFSDMIIGEVVSKAKYLVKIEERQLLFFEIQDDFYTILGINVHADFNFNQFETLQQAILAIPEGADAASFSLQQKYSKNKDEAVFELMQSGCNITDEITFQEIKRLVG